MKKELRPVHDHVVCDVCGRTILKGERTEAYIAPGGGGRVVCELCFSRAEHNGWQRASTAGSLPARAARDEPRRSVFSRLRRRDPEPYEELPQQPEAPAATPNGADPAEHGEAAPEPPPRPRTRPKDPRHVRAVPTGTEARIERALELFNTSPQQRTVAGLARTLGAPWVTAAPDPEQPSLVTLVVAWELSWYRYRIDLGDEADPVEPLDQGEEVDQIDPDLREWNATIDGEGRLTADRAVT